MASLEDLIGISLDSIGDDELEELIMKGRLAREESAAPKEKKEKQAKKEKFDFEVDMDEFE